MFCSFLKRWNDRRIATERLRRLARPDSRPVIIMPENNQRLIGDRAMIRECLDRR